MERMNKYHRYMLNRYRLKAKRAIRSAERFQGFAPIASYDFFIKASQYYRKAIRHKIAIKP